MSEDLIKIGEVSSIDPEKCTARVVFDDEGSFVSYDLPVMQRNTLGNHDFQMPEVGEDVLVLFLGPGQEDGIIVGSFYAGKVTPPETSADKRTIVFKDGTRVSYDRNQHKFTMTIDQTSIEVDRSSKTVSVPQAWTVNCTTANVTASGSVTVNSPSSTFTGDVTVEGHITGQGGMTVSGGSGGSAATITGSIHVVSGDVQADNISLKAHVHTCPQGGDTSPAK